MSLNGMAFRLENNSSRKIPYLTEFDETPRFWYPCVAHVAWIDFSSRTVEFRPSECRENFPPLFLSPLFLFLSFFLFFFSPFHRIPPILVCSYPISIFSFSHFSPISLFLNFRFAFLFFSPIFLFNPHPSTKFVNKWGKLPPTFLHATYHSHIFS